MKQERIPEVSEVSSSVLKFRWFTCNCYQFKFDSTSILVDPFLVSKDWPVDRTKDWYCGYTADDIESVDYVFINHTHVDHIGSLPEIYSKYHPRILCHSCCAANLSLDLDIPQTAIFPYEQNRTYDFGNFCISTITGRHNGNSKPSKMIINPGTEFEKLNQLGTLYNTNFILETKQHFSIAFCGGVHENGTLEKRLWSEKKCNIYIRQFGGKLNRNDAEGLADEFMETGAALFLPLHHEKFYDSELPASIDDMAEKVNKILLDRNYSGCLLNPKRGQWYSVDFGAHMEA